MTLLELERAMADAVMRPLTATYGMRKKSSTGASVAEEAAGFIKPNNRLSSFERLEIYNRQYWFRVLSALSEDFPALQATVGKKRFEALSRAYLEENPSRSFTLRNLGSNLETWLRANPKWTGEQHAPAIDVVRLEWAYVEAFDGGEEPALTLADAAQLGVDSQLSLQPHVRLLELIFPVDDFIIDVHRRQRSTSVASNAFTKTATASRHKRLKDLAPGAIFLAVHRFEHTVYYKRLPQEAYRMLRSLRDGVSLGMAIESAFESSAIPPSDQPGHIQEWFASWAELGWFCRPDKAPLKPPQNREKN